jgi:uncharacterized radical SAM protein YgiQ
VTKADRITGRDRDPTWDPRRWLPTTRDEVEARGWDQLDVILVSGDAYVDHPAFGTAAVGRMLEAEGLKVAIVAQPNWRDDLRDFKKLGAPRMFFGVTAGCMDSMVNRYTAAKKLRSEDAYTPGGDHGFRPDYATTVYGNILKDLYPDVPVMIGGIEASLRRVTHFDYWSDELKPSILVDSRADLLVYGMGELPLKETVRLLKQGVPFSSLTNVPQTAVLLPAGGRRRKTRSGMSSCCSVTTSASRTAPATRRISSTSRPSRTGSGRGACTSRPASGCWW